MQFRNQEFSIIFLKFFGAFHKEKYRFCFKRPLFNPSIFGSAKKSKRPEESSESTLDSPKPIHLWSSPIRDRLEILNSVFPSHVWKCFCLVMFLRRFLGELSTYALDFWFGGKLPVFFSAPKTKCVGGKCID